MKSYRILIIALLSIIILGIAFSKEAKNIRRAVLAEVKKYPKLEIQDLYKLAYQAAMGNEHMMSNSNEVRKYLEEELASIDTSSSEPLIEYLTSDSSIARVNLRAFKAHKGKSAKLLEEMIKTSSTVQPSTELLRSFWSDIEALTIDGEIQFKQQELSDYFRIMEEQNFPPVHHSKTVEENYRPAYRIVAGKQMSIR